MGLTRAQAEACGLGHLFPTESKRLILPEDVAPKSAAPDDGMNKTEARFARGLEAMKFARIIRDFAFEPERLRMADRTYYKPDFRVTLDDGRNAFIEVKGGFARDDAMVKIKTIAELHPYPFFLAVYRDHRWTITRLPSRNWGWINADIEWLI